MKTTYRKSRPENLFQALNLTPASRSSWVIILKCPYVSIVIAPRTSECKNSPSPTLRRLGK